MADLVLELLGLPFVPAVPAINAPLLIIFFWVTAVF